VISLLSLGFLHRFFNDVKLMIIGISVMLLSCLLLIQFNGSISFERFLFAIILMYSFGYPVGHTSVLTSFSKIIGNKPQGLLLGWFSSAGSLARVFFPILAGTISQLYGDSVLFITLSCLTGLSVVAIGLGYEITVHLIHR